MSKIPEFKFAIREDLSDTKDLFMPTRGEPHASGYDVRAAFHDRVTLIINPGEYFKIPLGFRALPQEGWWFELHPRSSSFVKKYMHNLIGIIDEHYSNEVIFAGQYLPQIENLAEIRFKANAYASDPNISSDYESVNFTAEPLKINFGDAIGQIIPIKRVNAIITQISNKDYDDLCKKRMAVRTGGFGSTDKSK